MSGLSSVPDFSLITARPSLVIVVYLKGLSAEVRVTVTIRVSGPNLHHQLQDP